MPSIIHKGSKPIVKPGVKIGVKPGAGVAPPTAVPGTPAAAHSAAPKLSFLKRGKEAQHIAQQEEKKVEMRKKANIFRFWVPKDGKGDITFLDGDLKDGILDIPFFHEHNVHMNGSWNNHFICTQDEEPCPICEGGGQPAYVGVLTVIDHGEYTSQRDGKQKKDNVKLFVAKRDTIKLLQDMAAKRGGLRGCRYEVKRIGDKSPNVGSNFDFDKKYTVQELITAYGKEKAYPVNYDEYMANLYVPAAELREMGFGTLGAAPIGSEKVEGGDYQM